MFFGFIRQIRFFGFRQSISFPATIALQLRRWGKPNKLDAPMPELNWNHHEARNRTQYFTVMTYMDSQPLLEEMVYLHMSRECLLWFDNLVSTLLDWTGRATLRFKKALWYSCSQIYLLAQRGCTFHFSSTINGYQSHGRQDRDFHYS